MRRTDTPDAERGNGQLTLTGQGLAWLTAALIMGAIGWIKSINLVLGLAYVMAALLFLNGVVAWLQVRRVEAGRIQAPPPFAGEATTIRLTATNLGRWPATVSVEDLAGEAPLNWLVYSVPAAQRADCTIRRIYTERGRFPSALRVASGFPLGLVRFERPVAGTDFIVLPAAGEVEVDGLRAWLLRQAGGDGRARRVLRRVTSEQADVRGVRPYQSGDPIRGIHWRSSARRGELMVREYDMAPSPDLVLVLEPWLPAKTTIGDISRLEEALSLAVSIVRAWSRSFKTRVTVVVAGAPEPAQLVAPNETSMREALAPLASVTGEESFDVPVRGVFDRTLWQSARILVSSRRHSPFAAVLTRATGRHFLAVAPADQPAWYHPPRPSGANSRL